MSGISSQSLRSRYFRRIVSTSTSTYASVEMASQRNVMRFASHSAAALTKISKVILLFEKRELDCTLNTHYLYSICNHLYVCARLM